MKIFVLILLLLFISPIQAIVGSEVQLYNDYSTISLDTELSGPAIFNSESHLNPNSMSTAGFGSTNGKDAYLDSVIQMSGEEGFACTRSDLKAGQSVSTFSQDAIYSTGYDYFGTDYYISPGKSMHSSLTASGSEGIKLGMVGFATPNQFTSITLDAKSITDFQGYINFEF
jgi:hypothetical protein